MRRGYNATIARGMDMRCPEWYNAQLAGKQTHCNVKKVCDTDHKLSAYKCETHGQCFNIFTFVWPGFLNKPAAAGTGCHVTLRFWFKL